MKTKNLVLERPSARTINPLTTIKAWFNKKNHLFSNLWEESVTNLQVIIVTNLSLSFVPLLAFGFENPITSIPFVLYFAFSVLLVKKGGIA